MAWKKQGVELPDGLHKAVRERARGLAGGHRGLGRFVWTVGALAVLDLEEEVLRRAATRLRDAYERDPETLTRVIGSGDQVPMLDLISEVSEEERAAWVVELQKRARKLQRKRGAKL